MKNRILYIIGFLFGRRFFYPLGVLLQHIAHRMMGIGNYENFTVSGEEHVVKIISQYCMSDYLIFIDVGAGDSSENTQLVKKYFSKAECYLFEPMKMTFKKLKKLYAGDTSVHCYNFAVGDKNSTVTMWDYQNDASEHASLHKESISSESSSHNVKQVTLSSFIKKEGIVIPDFVKTDIEGFDYFAIKGLKSYLNKISFLQFEFNSMNIYADVTFQDVYDLLKSDFKIFRMYQDGLLEITQPNPIYTEIYEYQNFFAINRKIIDERNLS